MIRAAVLILVLISSCTGNYVPKPRGYFRIEPPAPRYAMLAEDYLPYSFYVSEQAVIETDSSVDRINITYPAFNVTIYCSYKFADTHDLQYFEKECRMLLEKTVTKDSEITEQLYENEAERVFATLFTVSGKSPSPVQFMLTDSVKHFFRGALYYKTGVANDSTMPVTNYIKNDVAELIRTFRWKM